MQIVLQGSIKKKMVPSVAPTSMMNSGRKAGPKQLKRWSQPSKGYVPFSQNENTKDSSMSKDLRGGQNPLSTVVRNGFCFFFFSFQASS